MISLDNERLTRPPLEPPRPPPRPPSMVFISCLLKFLKNNNLSHNVNKQMTSCLTGSKLIFLTYLTAFFTSTRFPLIW